MTQGNVNVVTAEVRQSADQMTVVAGEASSSRAAVADSVSTQGAAAWKQQGTPGFTKFVDVLEAQAERLRSDLTQLGDALHAAADVYDQQDQEAGGAIDSTVRYD
jgi:uncharacterized protein YukE